MLDALDIPQALVVGIAIGTPITWMLAMLHPARVRNLAVMDAMLGRLPGAEEWLACGPPWCFGFHGVPGPAERVLEGHEAEYFGWFLGERATRQHAVEPDAQTMNARAYEGRDAFRGGFEHYRAMPRGALQIDAMAASNRLTQPTLATSGGVVGDVLHRQFQPHCDDLHAVRIADCGYNVPEEQPVVLAQALIEFFAA